MDAREAAFTIHRTSLFEQCLKGLQKRGGAAATAANKAGEFICTVSDAVLRKVFSGLVNGKS